MISNALRLLRRRSVNDTFVVKGGSGSAKSFTVYMHDGRELAKLRDNATTPSSSRRPPPEPSIRRSRSIMESARRGGLCQWHRLRLGEVLVFGFSRCCSPLTTAVCFIVMNSARSGGPKQIQLSDVFSEKTATKFRATLPAWIFFIIRCFNLKSFRAIRAAIDTLPRGRRISFPSRGAFQVAQFFPDLLGSAMFRFWRSPFAASLVYEGRR